MEGKRPREGGGEGEPKQEQRRGRDELEFFWIVRRTPRYRHTTTTASLRARRSYVRKR